MAMTDDFVADARRFGAKRPIGVDERGIAGVKPAVGAGNHQQLVAANYIFDWSMEPFGGAEALLTIYANNAANRQRGYFLPWEADAAVSMDIDDSVNAPTWFFTSTLTGCTVRVMPLPAGGLRLTHANARGDYNHVFAPAANAATDLNDPAELATLAQADRMGTAAAMGSIFAMMGPSNPGSRGVTKRHYAANVTDQHVRNARQRYRPEEGHRVKDFKAAKTSGKPEVSCFVWGQRHPTQGWRFWFQSTVQIAGTLERGIFHRKTKRIYGQSVVLCTPDRFYP